MDRCLDHVSTEDMLRLAELGKVYETDPANFEVQFQQELENIISAKDFSAIFAQAAKLQAVRSDFSNKYDVSILSSEEQQGLSRKLCAGLHTETKLSPQYLLTKSASCGDILHSEYAQADQRFYTAAGLSLLAGEAGVIIVLGAYINYKQEISYANQRFYRCLGNMLP